MVLVSGGTGFIGAHLLLRLVQQGKSVLALKRETSSLLYFESLARFYKISENALKNIHWLDCNLTNPYEVEKALVGIKQVYHCAGYVSFDQKHWDALLENNRTVTANLVNASLTNGIEQFCYLSSVAALDMSKGIKGKKTDWKHFRKTQPYGYSKYLGELEVYRGKEEGLTIQILNPAVVVGPTPQTHPLTASINRVRKGLSYYPIGGNSFIAVQALCDEMLVETPFPENKIIVGQHLSFKDFLTKLCEAAGVQKPQKALQGLPWFALYTFAKINAYLPFSSNLNLASIKALNRNKDYQEYMDSYALENQDLNQAITDAIAFTAT